MLSYLICAYVRRADHDREFPELLQSRLVAGTVGTSRVRRLIYCCYCRVRRMRQSLCNLPGFTVLCCQ
jgi:hypothetical protein